MLVVPVGLVGGMEVRDLWRRGGCRDGTGHLVGRKVRARDIVGEIQTRVYCSVKYIVLRMEDHGFGAGQVWCLEMMGDDHDSRVRMLRRKVALE